MSQSPLLVTLFTLGWVALALVQTERLRRAERRIDELKRALGDVWYRATIHPGQDVLTAAYLADLLELASRAPLQPAHQVHPNTHRNGVLS